jgi:cytochrome c oxidase cbb3-type subunit IV
MDLDLNMARAVITALAFTSFVGIACWAYSGARRQRFDDAARLPLDDEARPSPIAESTSESKGKR